jgi:hypothetical protein
MVVLALAISVAQEPSAVIIAMALFVPEPALPPVATMYTWSPLWQAYLPVMLKNPLLLLVTLLVSMDLGADASAVLPAAYSEIVAPFTGC